MSGDMLIVMGSDEQLRRLAALVAPQKEPEARP